MSKIIKNLNKWSDIPMFMDQFSSVAQSCPTLCDPMNCSTPGFLVHHPLPEFTQTRVHWVSDGLQPSHPLSSPLLLPSVFPRVFSYQSFVCIRWPKFWSFSFSINPSNEYSGFISFRTDWFISLLSKGLSRVFSSITIWKHQFYL